MKKFKLFLLAAVLLSSVGLHASNTITYTATAKLPGYNRSLDVGKTTFGPAITSHEFSNGTGTITCSGEITKIGDYAFYKCTGLTSITIPNSVTSIGKEAFMLCSGLTSVTIGNSVTTIGEFAFRDCSGLTSIEIPNSVTTIGVCAFYECSGLTSVLIGNSVTTIGNEAFYACSGLTSVTIGNSVTTIGNYAFRNCSGLTSIEIPNSVTTIGYFAFGYCSGLTSIEIPYSVTTIGDDAFYKCSGLTSVTVFWADEKSIPSIDCDVFQGIANGSGPSGATLYVLNGTKEYYQQADEWKEFGSIIEVLYTITYSATSKLSGRNGSLKVGKTTFGPAITSHEFFNGTGTITCNGKITTIGDDAFSYCSGLTSIEIPNSVTEIGSGAFSHCYGLTSIEIPNSVTTIGDDAFYQCTGLTSITIPNSVTTIGGYAFSYCSSLNSITIPNSVTTIGEHTFYNSEGLTSITIPNSVTTIGDYAFMLCSGLTSITIPNSVTTIGERAFYSCDGLTWVTIGNSVTTIGKEAFRLCSGLTSVTIPNSVTTIGANAFCECSGLTSVAIGNSVTTIENYAFYNCSGLTSVTVFWKDEKSIVPIASTVFGEIANGTGRSGATLHVPNGTAALYQQANVWKDFGSIIESDIVEIDDLWYRLLNVRAANVIANQYTRIPYSGDVVIPKTIIYNGNNSISAIEDSAFYNAKLTSLTVLTDFPLPCSEHTFTGQDKSIPLYVLDVPAFQSAKYWKEFTNILFYQPYKEEAKKKVQDIVNGIPSQYASLAKPIADNYFQDIENVNTIRQVDDLTTQALTKLQVFYDQGLWIKSGDYWLLKGKELLK